MLALLKNVNQFLDKTITLKGWIFNVRSSGKIMFLQFRDGTGFIQITAVKEELENKVWSECQKITMETSVEAEGFVKEEKRSPFGYEMQLKDLKIIHLAEDFPISKKEHGVDFLLDHRHLWIRSQRQTAILSIRDQIIWSIRQFMRDQGFILTDSPLLAPSACEGTTTLFKLDYFDELAYLSQSGQLYLEATSVALNRTYCFGPVFRAEKSKTRRHLMEFWMMDAEASFIEHKENMEIQESLISYILQEVLKNKEKELLVLERNLEPLKKILPPFYKLTHKEAIKKLRQLGSDIKEDDDLGADDETMLTKEYDKPLFIEKYPAKVKAFYMKRDLENKELALCDDLLAPEGYGEIIGGSQREDSIQELLLRTKEHSLKEEDFKWYLDLRRYGSAPHSGFGLGLERIIAWICGLSHVRETIPFPRLLNRLRP